MYITCVYFESEGPVLQIKALSSHLAYRWSSSAGHWCWSQLVAWTRYGATLEYTAGPLVVVPETTTCKVQYLHLSQHNLHREPCLSTLAIILDRWTSSATDVESLVTRKHQNTNLNHLLILPSATLVPHVCPVEGIWKLVISTSGDINRETSERGVGRTGRTTKM